MLFSMLHCLFFPEEAANALNESAEEEQESFIIPASLQVPDGMHMVRVDIYYKYWGVPL